MRTFYIDILGCKVNQYEAEQIATLLGQRGLTAVSEPSAADLHIVHTCSVTNEATAKSRQTVRRLLRIPHPSSSTSTPGLPGDTVAGASLPSPQVLVTGCWATSNPRDAASLVGDGAVITHHDDANDRLHLLLDRWLADATHATFTNESIAREQVNNNPVVNVFPKRQRVIGTTNLPLLDAPQASHRRAFLKIQDGCDAHCTYCIIPKLRPTLWNKPIDDVVEEARRLVDAGHLEIVMTGIFLGAYGHETALRHRQAAGAPPASPLQKLIESLCTRVSGLKRLRLSSLEPGDLSRDLLQTLASFRQVVPHFHLPLQSGSDPVLRRMNRQYLRDDFLRMVDDIHAAFDRPAITTDIIAGFPGESEADFNETVAVAEYARFIHIHAFPFSPRPGTAAARWKDDFVDPRVAADRIARLQELSARHSLTFRQQFLGQTCQILVERGGTHGRCERYFDIHIDQPATPGTLATVRIDRVTPARTHGWAMCG